MYLHCTLACSLVDLHSAEWRIIKTNVSAPVGIIFVSHPAKITAVLTVEVAIHGPCCVNKLRTRDEAIQYEPRMLSALRLVKTRSFHLFATLSQMSVFATIHVSALKQGIMITNYVVLSQAMR